MANAGRENIRETYESRFKAFANWCAARGRRPGPRTTEVDLVPYVSRLRREGIGHDTIRLSIATIVDMNTRLVSATPERLSLQIMAAFCDILSCTPRPT
ncbi:hypothetical protein ABZ923_28440 [Streptomyces sp. NPDC046881]|uniref:hypothetical protein n=1 Tax=Streptomyces sp. NPDC046881 TaxID=3155374 RepID=UPI0033F1CD46